MNSSTIPAAPAQGQTRMPGAFAYPTAPEPTSLEFATPRRAVRYKEVLKLIGLGKSTVYLLMNPRHPSHDPSFPVGFRLTKSKRGPRVWWLHEVLAWLQARHDHAAHC